MSTGNDLRRLIWELDEAKHQSKLLADKIDDIYHRLIIFDTELQPQMESDWYDT